MHSGPGSDTKCRHLCTTADVLFHKVDLAGKTHSALPPESPVRALEGPTIDFVFNLDKIHVFGSLRALVTFFVFLGGWLKRLNLDKKEAHRNEVRLEDRMENRPLWIQRTLIVRMERLLCQYYFVLLFGCL